MSEKTLIQYWIPADGDDENHPNIFYINKSIDSVKLKDVKASGCKGQFINNLAKLLVHYDNADEIALNEFNKQYIKFRSMSQQPSQQVILQVKKNEIV